MTTKTHVFFPASKYWEQLQKDAPTTKLWLDGFNTNVPDSTDIESTEEKFCTSSIALKTNLKNNLQKFARKNNFTLNLLIQTAWNILLQRHAGSDKIMYAATNFKKSLKLQIVFPVNIQFNADEIILSHIKQLANQINKSHGHLKSLKNLNLCEINYLYCESKTKINKISSQFKNFNLIFLWNGTQLSFFYKAKKFNPASIKSLLNHFQVILEKILQDPEQKINYFSILNASEKQTILKDWNSHSEYAEFFQQNYCIQDLFNAKVEQTPNHLAIQYGSYSLTYKELDELSNQLSHLLLRKGVQAGENIAVLMERSPAIIVAMMAIFKIGAVYVPINPKYPDERIQFILSDCQPNTILVNTPERISNDFLEKTIVLEDRYSTLKSTFNHAPVFNKVSPENIAYIIYTSGTTGQPKGVMIRHNSLVNLALWYQICFGINDQDRASQFASQGFDTFFCETVPFLAVGASIHIIDDNAKLTPSLFLPWLEKNNITVCDLPTSYAQMLFNLTWPTNLQLRILKIGGESITRYPAQVFSFDIWNTYGPTEATVETTYVKIFEANTPLSAQSCTHVPPPIGKPIANSEIYVVDKYLQPVPCGVAGELLIGGMGLSCGYLNRAQLTREKFIFNPFSSNPNSKLYKSGDLVRWLPNGNLEFIGRIDHQIKIRGYRIEINEIEKTLSHFPDVGEVVVLAKESENNQKVLIAYLVPKIEKIRIPYQERCLIAINDVKYIELLSEDISREGIAISGVPDSFEIGQSLKINIKLPGTNEGKWLIGRVMWQQSTRAGVKFDLSEEQHKMLQKSIEYYLSTHNLMETLQSVAVKRNLKKALKKKLPEYMVPSIFTILPEFPLTFNGKVDWKALPPPQDFERLLERKFVPPRNEVEKEIAAIWEELLNQHPISITDNFFDLGGNSLLVSELSVKILQKFHLAIPTKILFDLPFIPIIGEYINSKGKEYTHQTSIQDLINQDAILNDNIVPLKKMNVTHFKNPKGILLTGAGGFLGIYLLRELLAETNATIYCLIRKGEFETPAMRLSETLKHFGLEKEISLSNRRIIIINADLGMNQFGLPQTQYDSLAEKIDLIYHCGAQVNTMASYSALRTSNVLGTLQIIKFAVYKNNKAIHYISTMSSAYKKDARGHYVEEFPDAEVNDLVGGYAVSKWVSERLLTQLKKRGMPVSIYRSGYISGESQTGVTNTNDSLLLLIKGCIQLGYAPRWKEKINLIPVDMVSKAIVKISFYSPESSRVYHVDHPQGILWTDLIAWLNHYGYLIKLCSHSEWLKHLVSIPPTNTLYHFLPLYLSQAKEPETPETNTHNATMILKDLKFTYPKIDEAQLKTYMQYLREVGFLEAPTTVEEEISETFKILR